MSHICDFFIRCHRGHNHVTIELNASVCDISIEWKNSIETFFKPLTEWERENIVKIIIWKLSCIAFELRHYISSCRICSFCIFENIVQKINTKARERGEKIIAHEKQFTLIQCAGLVTQISNTNKWVTRRLRSTRIQPSIRRPDMILKAHTIHLVYNFWISRMLPLHTRNKNKI